jgi:four helix bundle protein
MKARGAESPAGFNHQVRIALKEVRETRGWLQLVLQSGLLDCSSLRSETQQVNEAPELIAILTASSTPQGHAHDTASSFCVSGSRSCS